MMLVMGLILRILDLIRLENELDLEEMEKICNMAETCNLAKGHPPARECGGWSRDTAIPLFYFILFISLPCS
jgi:hypothetical protein